MQFHEHAILQHNYIIENNIFLKKDVAVESMKSLRPLFYQKDRVFVPYKLSGTMYIAVESVESLRTPSYWKDTV